MSGAMGAGGDLEARNRLVEHNLRLVAHIIKKYYTQADNQEDLISIGTIGLIKAVNTFRADRGIKLATYASRCIENEILMYFRSQRKLQGRCPCPTPSTRIRRGLAVSAGCGGGRRHHAVGSAGSGGAAAAAVLGAGLPDGAGGGHHPEAVRAGGASAPKPSGRWRRYTASAAAMYRASKSGRWRSWKRSCERGRRIAKGLVFGAGTW